MGADASRIVERVENSDDTTKIEVTNCRKKIKGSHIKLISSKLKDIKCLTLKNCHLKVLPTELKNSNTKWEIEELHLPNNTLRHIPRSVGSMFPTLKILDLSCNCVKTVTEASQLHKLTSLLELDLEENKITELPLAITKIETLISLNLSKNVVTCIPVELTALSNLRSLNLSRNKISSIPEEVFCSLSGLQELDIRFNLISDLPPEISELKSLTILNAEHNDLKSLPEEISLLSSLTELRLPYNRITKLPDELTKLGQLKVLTLHHNKLFDIPLKEWGEAFTNLTSFTLAANPLDSTTLEFMSKYGALGLLNKADAAKAHRAKNIGGGTMRIAPSSADTGGHKYVFNLFSSRVPPQGARRMSGGNADEFKIPQFGIQSNFSSQSMSSLERKKGPGRLIYIFM